MEVKTTPKPETSEAVITITVPPTEFTPYVERAAKKISKEHPVKGFRPGKASLQVAFESYGKERVLHEALDRAVPHFFIDAVLSNDIEAINRPSITVEKATLEDGLHFTATVAVLPEVTLKDISGLTIAKREVSVSEADVDKELKYLAKMRSTPIDVARPAQTGDIVTIDFKVSMNGAVMEGGESKNHPVILGEGAFVPQFEEKLTGIQAGDERDFTIKFPSDYAREELRDQEAQVWVKAHAVQQRVLPEINDEFAKKIGKFENLQQLKEQLQKNMLHEREHKEKDRFQGELSEKLAEYGTYGTIPEVLIEREIDRRLEEFAQMLSYQQKTVDDYMAQQQKTLADIRGEMRPASELAVKIGLALRAFGKQAKIEVDRAEIDEKVNAYAQRFASVEEAEKEIDQEELRTNIESTLRNQKVLDLLEKKIKVTTEPAPTDKK